MKTKKKGFTLVELLAVIVVLGLLAAIAIPTSISISKKVKSQMKVKKENIATSAANLWAMDNKSCLEDAYKAFSKGQTYSASADCPFSKVDGYECKLDANNTITCYISLGSLANANYMKYDEGEGSNGKITDPTGKEDNLNNDTVEISYNPNNKSVNVGKIEDNSSKTVAATKHVKKSEEQTIHFSSSNSNSSITDSRTVSSITKIKSTTVSKGSFGNATISGNTISINGTAKEYSNTEYKTETVGANYYSKGSHCSSTVYSCTNGGQVSGSRCVAGPVMWNTGVYSVESNSSFHLLGSCDCEYTQGGWYAAGGCTDYGCAGNANYFRTKTVYGGGTETNYANACKTYKSTPINVWGICEWNGDYNATPSCGSYEDDKCGYGQVDGGSVCYYCSSDYTINGATCSKVVANTTVHYEYDVTVVYMD